VGGRTSSGKKFSPTNLCVVRYEKPLSRKYLKRIKRIGGGTDCTQSIPAGDRANGIEASERQIDES
jgi:hypothetical protein